MRSIWRAEPRIVHHHPAIDWLSGAAAAIALVLLLGVGQQIDDDAERQDAELSSARAFEQGRQQGRDEMAATVRDAYELGRRDAALVMAGSRQ
jgi:hypothetical protein